MYINCHKCCYNRRNNSKPDIKSEIHEIVGIILIILILIHLKQNKQYIKRKPKTINILAITNSILIITFTITILTGLLSSQLIPILNIHQITTNYIHKILSYVTLIIISIHLGLNINHTINKVNNKIKNKHIKHGIFLIIILTGIISFIQLDYINHLTGNIGFSANNTNIIINIIQYLSVVITITLLTNLIQSYTKKENTN